MPTEPYKILSIDPGTKEIGVAVFSGEDLVYYAVKTFKQRQPQHELMARISRYVSGIIQDYQPQALAIEKAGFIQKNVALLNVVSEEIKHTASRHGLSVHEYAPSDVRRAICQSEKATKCETARCIAVRYPELSQYLNQPSRWGELYWANVFDAVAVGIMHLKEAGYGTGVRLGHQE